MNENNNNDSGLQNVIDLNFWSGFLNQYRNKTKAVHELIYSSEKVIFDDGIKDTLDFFSGKEEGNYWYLFISSESIATAVHNFLFNQPDLNRDKDELSLNGNSERLVEIRDKLKEIQVSENDSKEKMSSDRKIIMKYAMEVQNICKPFIEKENAKKQLQNQSNNKNSGEQNKIDLDLDETTRIQSQNEIFDFVPGDIPSIEKNNYGEDNYFFDDGNDDKELKNQIEKINLPDYKSKINQGDKDLLIDFIYPYEGEQMKNIEDLFDLFDGNIDIDLNIDKHELLSDFIYNLEIRMEESGLLNDLMRQKFAGIANLISISEKELKNKSEVTSKIVETVANFVKDIVSKSRDDIKEEVKADYLKESEGENPDDKENKINDDDKQLLINFISENKDSDYFEWDDDISDDGIKMVFDIINNKIDKDKNLDVETFNLLGNFISDLSAALDKNGLLTKKMDASVRQIIELIEGSKKSGGTNVNKIVEEIISFLKNIVSRSYIREKMESYRSKPDVKVSEKQVSIDQEVKTNPGESFKQENNDSSFLSGTEKNNNSDPDFIYEGEPVFVPEIKNNDDSDFLYEGEEQNVIGTETKKAFSKFLSEYNNGSDGSEEKIYFDALDGKTNDETSVKDHLIDFVSSIEAALEVHQKINERYQLTGPFYVIKDELNKLGEDDKEKLDALRFKLKEAILDLTSNFELEKTNEIQSQWNVRDFENMYDNGLKYDRDEIIMKFKTLVDTTDKTSYTPDDYKTVSDFAQYLLDLGKDELEKIKTTPENKEKIDAAVRNYKTLEYLKNKLDSSTESTKDKIVNFFKKFGSVISYLFKKLFGLSATNELNERNKPLEIKNQKIFESAFSDLRKKLDQIEKEKNKTDQSMDLEQM